MGESGVVSIKVMTNKFTGEPAGYGFINFDSDQTAIIAMHRFVTKLLMKHFRIWFFRLGGKIIPNSNPPVRFKLNHNSTRLQPGEVGFTSKNQNQHNNVHFVGRYLYLGWRFNSWSWWLCSLQILYTTLWHHQMCKGNGNLINGKLIIVTIYRLFLMSLDSARATALWDLGLRLSNSMHLVAWPVRWDLEASLSRSLWLTRRTELKMEEVSHHHLPLGEECQPGLLRALVQVDGQDKLPLPSQVISLTEL